MEINYRYVLRGISLPLALYLLLPFADPYCWQVFSLEHLCQYWRGLPFVFLLVVYRWPVLGIIEIIFLVRWAVKPCLKTGIWLTLMTFLTLGLLIRSF